MSVTVFTKAGESDAGRAFLEAIAAIEREIAEVSKRAEPGARIEDLWELMHVLTEAFNFTDGCLLPGAVTYEVEQGQIALIGRHALHAVKSGKITAAEAMNLTALLALGEYQGFASQVDPNEAYALAAQALRERLNTAHAAQEPTPGEIAMGS